MFEGLGKTLGRKKKDRYEEQRDLMVRAICRHGGEMRYTWTGWLGTKSAEEKCQATSRCDS